MSRDRLPKAWQFLLLYYSALLLIIIGEKNRLIHADLKPINFRDMYEHHACISNAFYSLCITTKQEVKPTPEPPWAHHPSVSSRREIAEVYILAKAM